MSCTKHGRSSTKEYRAWADMKTRCLNKKCKWYESYGGRGITICDRWIHSFENFLEDMGECPEKSFSLDRLDNNEGYSPDNCRWATKQEQVLNRRLLKNNTSGQLGVSWNKKRRKWKAYKYVKGKTIDIGFFDTPEEAAGARRDFEIYLLEVSYEK